MVAFCDTAGRLLIDNIINVFAEFRSVGTASRTCQFFDGGLVYNKAGLLMYMHSLRTCRWGGVGAAIIWPCSAWRRSSRYCREPTAGRRRALPCSQNRLPDSTGECGSNHCGETLDCSRGMGF